MISGEGEVVPFTERLYPKGNVEYWLLEVERVMRESLRKILSDSLEDYKTVCRACRLHCMRYSEVTDYTPPCWRYTYCEQNRVRMEKSEKK